MSRYVHRFGFGEALGTDFKGQSQGIVSPTDRINDSALASMSMGYNVSVTPLQMATAASAVANGGTLYAPHVVARDRPRRQARSRRAEGAAAGDQPGDRGDGHNDHGRRRRSRHGQGRADGSLPGGRQDRHGAASSSTGTTRTEYNSSFVGFVPSRNPVFTILVVIDNPRQGGHYGGAVAAPIFKRIADAALRQVGVPATIRSDSADRRHGVRRALSCRRRCRRRSFRR